MEFFNTFTLQITHPHWFGAMSLSIPESRSEFVAGKVTLTSFIKIAWEIQYHSARCSDVPCVPSAQLPCIRPTNPIWILVNFFIILPMAADGLLDAFQPMRSLQRWLVLPCLVCSRLHLRRRVSRHQRCQLYTRRWATNAVLRSKDVGRIFASPRRMKDRVDLNIKKIF